MYNSGKENIKGYYGNWFIRLDTKYSGIGIHGTHEPEHIGERSTEGSIRLNNYHLDSLRAMINVGIDVRIESSRLDREADGKPLIAEVAAETPIMNDSATPVIEERNDTPEPVEEVATEEKVAKAQAPAPAQSNTDEDEDVVWYTIAEGDLVGRVAARYGMSLAEIKRLNPDINVDRVAIGQKIRVKGKPVAESKTEVAQTAQESNSEEVWHTVADGDLVGRIASKYSTTVRRIQELNPNLNPDRIRIGQKIRVK
jgi:membrane-bound lytic murein transglycosylase D